MKTQTKTKFSLFAVLLAVLVMPLVFAFTACGNNDKATTLNNDMLTEYIQDGHQSFVYTGSAITFKNDKEDIAKILKEKIGEVEGLDKEYEIFYENNIDVSKGSDTKNWASIVVKAKTDATHIKGEARGYFLITKATTNAAPTINETSFNYGDKLAFTITKATEGTTFGADTVKYQYKTSASAEDATWTDIKEDTSLDVGTYKVKAVIAGTDNYVGVESAEKQFAVAKATNEWKETPSITNAKITYGDEIKVNMGEAKFGTVVVNYFKANKVDDTYTPTGIALSDQPTNAGDYVAQFSVAGTDNYTELTKEVDFTIAKANITPTVSMSGYAYATAEAFPTPTISGNTGSGTVTYYYNTSNVTTGGTKWENITSTTLGAGTYYMYAVVALTPNYNGATSEAVAFTIAPGTATGITTLDALQSALTNANYSTIQLTDNVDLNTTQITIPRTLTLDLNGKKITSSYDPTDQNAIKSAIAVTTSGVVLTVTGNGTIDAVQTTIRANDGAKLVIENGTFTSTKGNGVATNKGEIEITTATITANAADTAAVASFNGGKLTINGGTFYGNNDGVVQTNGLKEWGGSTIDINGGTFIGKISDTTTSKGRIAYGLYVANNDTVTVDNATFNIENGVGIVARSGNTTIGANVTFTFKTTQDGLTTGYIGDSKNVKFTAGEKIIVDYVANYPAGIPTVTNSTNRDVVAYTGSTNFAKAINQTDTAFNTLSLTEDVSVQWVTIARSMTLDLNGKTISNKTITVSGEKTNVTLKNGTINGTYIAVKATAKAKLTVEDVKISTTGEYAAIASIDGAEVIINKDTEVTSQEHAVKVQEGSTLTINGGTFTATNNAVVATAGDNGYGKNTITINGGTFNGSIVESGYIACGVYVANDDIVSINGGTFNITNGIGVLARSGTTKVENAVKFVFTNADANSKGKVGASSVEIKVGAEVVIDYQSNYNGGNPTVKTTKNTTTYGTAPTKSDSN